MEDVVLHYQPRSSGDLPSLLEKTEKLLKPFPCRTPPVFTPWFPTTATDRRLPIRPARPAPIISSSDDPLITVNKQRITDTVAASLTSQGRKPENYIITGKRQHEGLHSDNPECHFTKIQRRHPPCHDIGPPNHQETEVIRLSPQKTTHRNKGCDIVAKRSWSLFSQCRVALHSFTSLSRHFHDVVSLHRLHLRQRAKWIISEDNCGAGRDIEQVWQTLCRSSHTEQLPSCNANIQRDRAEIWVFCDVLCSEQVGHFLKDELCLSGNIVLSVPRKGNIFSI